MVTTPTSVKSFMLKLVELLHKLDTSRLARAEIREDYSGPAGGIRHVSYVSWPTTIARADTNRVLFCTVVLLEVHTLYFVAGA